MSGKITETEPKCVKCGKSEFELSRMACYQILAVCINCGEPYTIDAIDRKTGKPSSPRFWPPEMEE